MARRRWALLLLLVPVLAVLITPLYNRRDPAIAGVPFFVWYQFAAVLLGGAATGLVYHLRGE